MLILVVKLFSVWIVSSLLYLFFIGNVYYAVTFSVASEPVEKWDGSTASASPPPSVPTPPLPSAPLPCREAAPLNPARGSGGAL